MSTAASAVTTVESATTTETATPSAPAFDASNQKTWSREQRDEWNRSGQIPKAPSTADSATATEKDTTKADSSTAKPKTADTASDSATDKDQKPHQKTKEDTERRFQQLLDDKKRLEQRLEALEKGTSSTRDTKQESQPAKEDPAPKPLLEFLEEWFPKNPGKKYEQGVEAWAAERETWSSKQTQKRIDQALAAERQRLATEAARKELSTKVQDAEKRYGKDEYQSRVKPASAALTDEQIPFAVRAVINDSPIFADLMYVLGEPGALADLVATAKTNPTAALRKVMLTEQLVQAELAKSGTGKGAPSDTTDDGTAGDGTKRDASGKFVSSKESSDAAASETKPRAPKPISEVGGRGTAPDDPLRTAAKANRFSDFEAEMNRRMRAEAKA